MNPLDRVPRILFASGNRHKASEMAGLLEGAAVLLRGGDVGLAVEAEETGATFADNAAIKAAAWAAAADAAGIAADWILADDSGLEVDALGGRPGVHSARYAALDDGRPGNSSDTENNAKLMREMAGVGADLRSARFRCVLALAPVQRGGPIQFFSGCCEGSLAMTPSGGGGFGYDPLFVPAGRDRSLAELGEAVKREISHRARAVAALRRWLGGGADGGVLPPVGARPHWAG